MQENHSQVWKREMNYRKAWLLIAIAILAGCAAQQPSPYPDAASLLNAPLPRDQRELARQCLYLRQEIAIQKTKASTAATTQPGTTILIIQNDAERNIAALTQRSNNLGCDNIIDAQSGPTPVEDKGNYIDMCMAKCKQYTSRTPEQCFDSCK